MKAKMNLFLIVAFGVLALCGAAWAVEVNEPISHWKFDETSGTIAIDCVGDNNGTVHGATWTTGQIEGALSFDGNGDYVETATSSAFDISGTQPLSISAWIKTDTLSTYDYALVAFTETGYESGAHDKDLEIDSATGVAMFYAWDVGRKYAAGTTNVADGKWHHLVGTYTGTHLIIYVDGNQEGNPTAASQTYDFSTPQIVISFKKTGNRDDFNGTIDDVRIYDRALSAEEVQQLYYEGLSAYERAIIQIEDAVAEKEEMLEGIEETLEKEGDAYEALEKLLENGDYGDLKNRDIVKTKQKVHSAMQHQEQSIDALEKSIEKLYDALTALGWEPELEPDPNLISHWKFDETSGTTALDCVGDNNGTVYGAQWTTGQVGGALSFDGVNDYVDCGSGPAITGTGNFTVSAWVKVTELPADGALTVVNQRNTNSANGSYIVYVRSSGYVHFEVYNGGYGFYFDSDVSVGDGFWHHIVGVRTSTTEGQIYVDGNPAGSGSGPVKSLNSVDVAIGRWNGGGHYLNGAIDDVRIYNRALSAEEIQQLYQDGL